MVTGLPVRWQWGSNRLAPGWWRRWWPGPRWWWGWERSRQACSTPATPSSAAWWAPAGNGQSCCSGAPPTAWAGGGRVAGTAAPPAGAGRWEPASRKRPCPAAAGDDTVAATTVAAPGRAPVPRADPASQPRPPPAHSWPCYAALPEPATSRCCSWGSTVGPNSTYIQIQQDIRIGKIFSFTTCAKWGGCS